MVRYFHLRPNSPLPDISKFTPFKVVLILEEDVETDWQSTVSEGLVDMGCLYMMAWGIGCSSWEDSVDITHLAKYDFQDVPNEKFIMTTAHEGERLNDVFWYSKNCAMHPHVRLDITIIIHIADRGRAEALLAEYKNV